MYHNQVIYTVVAIAVIATSCERLSSSDSDKVDKTKDWTEVVTMVVSHEISAVYDMEGIPSEGMMVKEDGKKNWNPMYFWEIEGFEYIRGFEYLLKVEKTHLVDPPQDASSVKYKLIEILSEEFKLGEGYVMSDEYIHYAPTSYREEFRTSITKKQNEYYLIIKKSEKTNALAFLADNGYTIMENSEDKTGTFLILPGKLQDTFQITVKGSGDINQTPGVIYAAPLYHDDQNFKVQSFGRGNMVSVGFPYQWDQDKQMRHITYIERYAEQLNIYLVDKILSEYGNALIFGVTNESAGNAIEVYNWFSEAAGYSIVNIEYPEWMPTPDEDQ
ncbi:MAG: DUF4377 domain-containing protein [Bacteroidales bacterium]|nr:DUF4377 domain-containing protein [Bacteroidales bacterium]